MTRRSRLATIGTCFAIIFVAGGFVYLRGGSTPLPVDQAVERFRAATPAPKTSADPGDQRRSAQSADVSVSAAGAANDEAAPTSAPSAVRPLLPEGVYVYATTGHDEVDVLGGNGHTYPDETTITVRHAGCGVTERWDVLDERWDERESCRTAGGDVLLRVTSYHEFFRQGDTRTLSCDGYTYPAGAQPGDTWSARCATDTTVASTTLRAVGWETVEVGGQKLRTLHVRADTKLSGEQQGESHRDVWGSQDAGLVLRERASVRSQSRQPAVGAVTYTEEFEIRLKSLEPRT